jgi:hypothetical protein
MRFQQSFSVQSRKGYFMHPTTSPATTSTVWYHEDRGVRSEGKTEAELIALIRAKHLLADHRVWAKGMPDWVPVHDTALANYLEADAPPPIAGDRINNTVVWFLAFAPLIGYFMEWFIAGAMHGKSGAEYAMADARYWYVTVVLNVVLSLWDERRLQQAGHSTKEFRGFLFLVPVYLYQRAKYLKQSVAYFTVWLVCFGLFLLA